MKRLLIISRPQFGYHTDIFKWCEYLRDDYQISVVTFDDSKEKISIPGVRNVYVPNARFRSLRGVLFMLISFIWILFAKGTVMVCYFKECVSYKRLFPWKRMILDIRTLDVSPEESARRKNDCSLRKCVQLYDFVSYITEGVREKAGIPHEKSALLPLGAEPMAFTDKSFEKLKLLYVGTLTGRSLEKTVLGLSIAMKSTKMDVEYDIVGDGRGNELEILESTIRECGLEDTVRLHGYVRHDCLVPFLEKSNVGVSFVPLTDYYDFQPPTKTFEYALSGMYVIATATAANREIITEENGYLVNDTPESFAEALTRILKEGKKPDSVKIRNSVSGYEWRNIINDYLRPLLVKFESSK